MNTPMSATVAFRVDAAIGIGLGHVMRCLTLAEALRRRGAQVVFICRPMPGDALDWLKLHGMPVIELPPSSGLEFVADDYVTWLGVPLAEEIAQSRAALAAIGRVDLMVVDHYGLDTRWESAMRGHVTRILCIDDLANRQHDCDVLLDQTLGRAASDYANLVPVQGQILLGTEFALLRPQFAETRNLAPSSPCGRSRVLVSLGGTDPNNLTHVALEGLLTLGGELDIDVVLGGNTAIPENLPPRIHVHRNVSDMAGLIRRADFAIGAGGTSVWERCCLGIPSLLIVTSENQRTVAERVSSVGAARIVGDWKSATVEAVAFAARELLHGDRAQLAAMREAAIQVCDGLGASRVAGTVFPISLCDGRQVSLRKLRVGDCHQIYAWQSEPGGRRFSRNPEVPDWEEHCRWFVAKQRDQRAVLEIVSVDGADAGIVRLDPIDGSSMEVSILISEIFRGQGVGVAALQLLSHYAPWADLVAEIHPDNIGSRRAFERVGFVQADISHFRLSQTQRCLKQGDPASGVFDGRFHA